jgi:hypothetical protein
MVFSFSAIFLTSYSKRILFIRKEQISRRLFFGLLSLPASKACFHARSPPDGILLSLHDRSYNYHENGYDDIKQVLFFEVKSKASYLDNFISS